jgi:hypothetical protein
MFFEIVFENQRQKKREFLDPGVTNITSGINKKA